MYTRDAIQFFGTRAEIAKRLKGLRHRSAVYQWDENKLVPLGAAVLLARQSQGALRVNDRLYEAERRKQMQKLNAARKRARS